MAIDWDIFVDEHKDGGRVVAIGALCLEAGVTPNLQDTLVKEKSRVENRLGHGIGEIHWKRLDGGKSDIAVRWMNAFLSGPMMFYVRFDAFRRGSSVVNLTKALVERLERSLAVPGGLERDKTTVHVDYDTANTGHLLASLRRDFGVLRAFKWHSHGSELIQLSDVLLGITLAESNGALPSNHCPVSRAEKHRLKVMEYVRVFAKKRAARGKRNHMLVMHGNTDEVLL
jgi:hypothetical protein